MTDRTNAHISINKRPVLVLRFLAPFAWALAILWLSLTSSPPEIPGVLGWDKLLHAGAYGLLALLVAQLLVLYFQQSIFATGLFCTLYGALVEVLQLIGDTGRMFEWLDILADVVGIVLACVIFRHAYALALKNACDKGHTDG